MVITSPFSSIRGFIATRPPLVLFTFCLIAFAVTTFTFAYYVEHKDVLPNLDAQRDWVSFMSYLSKKKVCITQNDNSGTSLSNISQQNESEYTVYLTAALSSNASLQNVQYVQGYISTQDWVSECSLLSMNRVKISYSIQHENNSSFFTVDNVCIVLTGPRELLEAAPKNSPCHHPATSHNTWNINEKKTESCTDGISTVLKYQLNPRTDLSLTMHDRSIINLHLFHTSYFLLVMAITLICYAMIKGKPVVKHQPLDKTPMDA